MWALLALSLLATDPVSERDLLIGDEVPPDYSSTVTTEFRVTHATASSGWGSFDFAAAPERNEIRVDLLLGAPFERARWGQCEELELVVDGRSEPVATRYAGVPMSRGVFDAIEAKLTIAQVRGLAEGGAAEARLCGDVLTIGVDQQRELRRFVEEFDERAINIAPSLETPRPELGPEHEWEVDVPDYPAPV